ncbi:MAG: serine hydrolase domain-containing protein [Candidatus Sulfotelmatobacter sp.]
MTKLFPESASALKFIPPGSSLRLDLDHQDTIFESGFGVVREAIAGRVFPGASVAVTHQSRLIGLKAFGQFTYEADAPAVTTATLFDLGSVTKVVATTAMAMRLYERGLLDLDAAVAAIVPEFLADAERDERRHDVTMRMLLAHCSGLPAHEKLFLRTQSRDELLRAVFSMPLVAEPGSKAAYSDIGFILLGAALERMADEAIDSFCQREIFAPLGIMNTAFNPPVEVRAQIPPTVDDRSFRHRIVQGEVFDENTSAMGGVAPHAGIFSTAADMALFAHAMLHSEGLARRDTIALFTRRESAPQGTSHALGWDTPSAPSQSGEYFGAQSFGHLGYTGTSLWIDPERQLSITLLTNRTWPDCSNVAIKQVRPKFHDAVVEAIDSQGWPGDSTISLK